MENDYRLLIASLKKEYFNRKKTVISRFQISSAELDILLFLANNKGFDTSADIVRLKKMQKSHVSLAVKELTQKGYLTCETNSLNHKKIHLKLTEASKEIVHAGQAMQREYLEFIFAGFSKEERLLILELSSRIESNLHGKAPKQESSTYGHSEQKIV